MLFRSGVLIEFNVLVFVFVVYVVIFKLDFDFFCYQGFGWILLFVILVRFCLGKRSYKWMQKYIGDLYVF